MQGDSGERGNDGDDRGEVHPSQGVESHPKHSLLIESGAGDLEHDKPTNEYVLVSNDTFSSSSSHFLMPI